jgi:hypothetical protein
MCHPKLLKTPLGRHSSSPAASKDFLRLGRTLNSFRASRVEVLPVASEVLRTQPSQRPTRLLKAPQCFRPHSAEPASSAAPQGSTVRPVAYCGPRCRVRRDSTVFPVFYDGLAAQCGPLASSLAPPSSRSSPVAPAATSAAPCGIASSRPPWRLRWSPLK